MFQVSRREALTGGGGGHAPRPAITEPPQASPSPEAFAWLLKDPSSSSPSSQSSSPLLSASPAPPSNIRCSPKCKSDLASAAAGLRFLRRPSGDGCRGGQGALPEQYPGAPICIHQLELFWPVSAVGCSSHQQKTRQSKAAESYRRVSYCHQGWSQRQTGAGNIWSYVYGYWWGIVLIFFLLLNWPSIFEKKFF